MIRNLYQEEIRKFGTILPASEEKPADCQHILLQPGMTQVYRALEETWLCADSSMTILSVSLQDGEYADFYLDKPVKLKADVYFTLASLAESVADVV